MKLVASWAVFCEACEAGSSAQFPKRWVVFLLVLKYLLAEGPVGNGSVDSEGQGCSADAGSAWYLERESNTLQPGQRTATSRNLAKQVRSAGSAVLSL